jgi:hypothetical protein
MNAHEHHVYGPTPASFDGQLRRLGVIAADTAEEVIGEVPAT